MVIDTTTLRNYNSVDNTRFCKNCNEHKDLAKFSTRVVIGKPHLQVREICKECNASKVKACVKYREYNYRQKIRERRIAHILLQQAKTRSKSKNLEFNLDITDVIVPKICPLLLILLMVAKNSLTANSPSLDRIDSSRGYVKDNVWVISHRANTIKNDATLKELQLITKNLGSCIKRKNCKNAEMPICSRASGKTEEGSETKDTKVSLEHPPLEIVMT